ncbi:ABC-2 type transport system ATP-binding protein [Brevibacterium sanguinis]|uniref:ABC-2 type transport system ATP-binding protein n=2 Tax=Brevibacterium TaxID=1696 RepID=A0A366IQ62_9MICO|nr:MULTISPECIES: ABC transporter ATP-binding protein [Brevibacterium]RBP67931.1 ABC-2 type transport system ATP-binding protein [Brevibacterium sanguinis]RBP74652.1 ABC-2 type transport system ATP-binding protein [Brevibacterium celere]
MMNNQSPAIGIADLVVVRGRTTVLDGLSLSVERGAITGLLGPSGSGKTTLMRSIVGTQRITSGSVTVLGLAAGDKRLRTRLAYVTQSASVYDDLSVRQNLRYFAAVLGTGDIESVIEATDLTDVANRPVGDLSGGQRSRVSLAAALLGGPEVLVLDEPTVGLDPILRASLWDLFHRLASSGTTLLVSSHVMDEATRCDDLLLLSAGRLLAHGTPTGLIEETGTDSIEEAFISCARGGRS